MQTRRNTQEAFKGYDDVPGAQAEPVWKKPLVERHEALVAPRLGKSKGVKAEAGGAWETPKAAPHTQKCVTDLQDAVQGSLVQRSSSLVHQSCPDYVHRVGGQRSRQAANKTGPGGGDNTEINPGLWSL